MIEKFDFSRRRFLSTAAITLAAGPLVMLGSADAKPFITEPAHGSPVKRDITPSFGAIKQINAGLLNIGYVEAGPANGPPVILLHGWPYDIYSFVDVAPLLAANGYRVISPTCAGMVPHTFFQLKHSVTVSRPRFRLILLT